MQPTSSGERLLLVSNRLPVAVSRGASEQPEVQLTAGGLATGLMRPHQDRGGIWIGWPGVISDKGELDTPTRDALEQRNMVGVGLTQREHEHYYTRFSNRCLWPLFHYFPDRVEFEQESWQVYQDVNRKFADAVLEHAQPDDLVFVHDFHLALLPGMLREARPELRIGFFLHIPFPSSEMYRVLPPREEILRGLLGADVIGFHTLDYLSNFRSAVARVIGAQAGTRVVGHEGREIRLLAEPLGIAPEEWESPAADGGEQSEYHDLVCAAEGRKIILGVDRLDYTKGIPARLRAFQEMLRRDPSLVERLMMIQVAVPSRVEVEEYRDLKREVDRLAGQINSEFGRPGRQPLHYQFRGVPRAQLNALYRVADIALVTPLRDGLNLVAKEYVATRERDDGVLVIGEFAGAAWELAEAIKVNPFDAYGIAQALHRALEMSLAEQRRRMQPMRARIRSRSVHRWAERCLAAIRAAGSERVPEAFGIQARRDWMQRWSCAERRVLLLDYDGSLREFTQRPEQAAPSPKLLHLLKRLASVNGVEAWIVSGRSRADLERWLADTGVGLIAEHGAWIRDPGDSTFRPALELPSTDWQEQVESIMSQFSERVPGSLIEKKPVSIAWHYRACDRSIAVWQAPELASYLVEALGGEPLEVLRGDNVVEVRPRGIDKGSAVTELLRAEPQGTLLLAAGDDRTDEDLFERLPARALTLLVGKRGSAARYRLDNPASLRTLLGELLDALPLGTPSVAVG